MSLQISITGIQLRRALDAAIQFALVFYRSGASDAEVPVVSRSSKTSQCRTNAPSQSASPVWEQITSFICTQKKVLRWDRLCRTFLLVASACTLPGCASIFYAKTPTGNFSGKLDVEWIAPNQFIYRPHPADPLIYVTADGHKIQPRTMYTDGGSIPRLFWSVPEFGPWDFAPGFIIHDWLFVQRHCKEGDWQVYDFPRSAEILAEAIKTQMVKGESSDAVVVWAIYEAVKTPIAQRSWELGECKEPPPDNVMAPTTPGGPAGAPMRRPVKLMTIEFR